MILSGCFGDTCAMKRNKRIPVVRWKTMRNDYWRSNQFASSERIIRRISPPFSSRERNITRVRYIAWRGHRMDSWWRPEATTRLSNWCASMPIRQISKVNFCSNYLSLLLCLIFLNICQNFHGYYINSSQELLLMCLSFNFNFLLVTLS